MQTSGVSKDIVKMDLPNGYCLFKLGKLLKDKNISINQFMKATETDFKTIKKTCKWFSTTNRYFTY